MPIRRFHPLVCAVILAAVPICPSPAQEGAAEKPASPTAASLTEEQKARAVQFMCSGDRQRREGAYAAGRNLGEEGNAVYRELLEKAEAYHKQRLASAVVEARSGGAEIDGDLEELERVREETMAFLRTDHKKDAGKIAELGRMYGEVESAVKKVESELRSGGGFAVLGESIQILAEIWVEEAWCGGKKLTMREAALANERDAVPEDLQERVFAMEGAAGGLSELEDANAFNNGLRWASPPQKAFAKTLNFGRYVMGLNPLRLDERLSEAAKGHSDEMKSMRYFAHESPVEANRTPPMRAKNAEFQGGFRGENIFMNSGAATSDAAYQAWWASDGHRFIMFGDGQDTLGLGVSGGATHWTMMTGRKRG